MLATLSDALLRIGIAHEIAGLTHRQSRRSTDGPSRHAPLLLRECDWDEARGSLAVFVTSAVRGRRVPQLAYQILNENGSVALRSRVQDLRLALEGADAETAVAVAAAAHESIGLPSKITAWQHSAALLRRLYARVSQDRARNLSGPERLQQLAQLASEEGVAILTYAADDPQQIPADEPPPDQGPRG